MCKSTWKTMEIAWESLTSETSEPMSTELVLKSTESDTQARERLCTARGEKVTVTDDRKNLGKTPLKVRGERLKQTFFGFNVYLIIGASS